MKYCVFALLLATVYGVTPELESLVRAEAIRMGGECKAEMGATDDDIEPLLAHSLPTTEKGKCFIACMYKKMGVQDSDGSIKSADEFLEKIKPIHENYYAKAKMIADICIASDHDHDDECDIASSLYSCWLEQKAKMGLPNITLK
ncbi:general odorant-binding protein 19d-like [Photinus pyralis]|uniref:general odorant-binding protein 19d-like n=1 Tax=Photinus pyralis TaxID=7054 RepID=UPI00126733CF|nr:general odorant-binding protein 19d-like [Photinus pyralis]